MEVKDAVPGLVQHEQRLIEGQRQQLPLFLLTDGVMLRPQAGTAAALAAEAGKAAP